MKFMLLALLIPSLANAYSYDVLHPSELSSGSYQVDCKAHSIQSRSCFGIKRCLPFNGGQNFSGAYYVNGLLKVTEKTSEKIHSFDGQVTLFQKIKKDWGGSFTETQEVFDLKSNTTLQISDLGQGKTQIIQNFHSEKSDDRRGRFNDKIFSAPKNHVVTETRDVKLVSTSQDEKGKFLIPIMSYGDKALIETHTSEEESKNQRNSVSRFETLNSLNAKADPFYFYGLDDTLDFQVRSENSSSDKYESVELHFLCTYTPIK